MEEYIKKLEERKATLTAEAAKCEDIAELRKIMQQIVTVNEDLATLRDAQAKDAGKNAADPNLTDERTLASNAHEEELRRKEEESRRGNPPKYIPGRGFIPAEERTDKHLDSQLEQREQAGKELKENRAVKSPLSNFGELRTVTVGSGSSILVPNHYSTTINPDFNSVSSLVDSVAHLSLDGGESFKQAYVTNIGSGSYTAEGANAAEAETSFDYADINRTKITAYSEVTKELQKLPNAAYADTVFQNIRTSMRQVLSKEIMVGQGEQNQIVGIFSAEAKAIDSSTDLNLSVIDDKTLDEILYNYGGNEDVESPAVLLLNKKDLLAFAKVRTSTKQKFYDITLSGNGNTGNINGVPFLINSACKALSLSGTSAAEYCMAYGNLSNYQLVEFSPMTVEKSDDYKFRQGMTAYRGEAFMGGNVVKKNGFLRVKKASS